MIVSFAQDGELHFDSALVSLSGVRPIINGMVQEVPQPEIDHTTNGAIQLRYTIPAAGMFGIDIVTDQQPCSLHYWLEGLPDDFTLDSFGIRFTRIANARAYLRNGYISWDGSFYVDVEGAAAITPTSVLEKGYAVTQLLPFFSGGSVIIGFDRHDRFQQTFTFDTRHHPLALTIETLWDRKDRRGSARCTSERLILFEHPGVEDALREWARIVAVTAPVPPRLSTKRIMGWCSWYNLYAYINEDNIRDHLRGAAQIKRRDNLPMWVFQVDDGFTPEMGDWLEVRPQFPRGIKPLLDDIRAAGFTPGLWIAPFTVGNRSHLYRDHPDWVVKDRLTGGPLAHMRFYAEFRWHKRSEEYYILDMTHPNAFNYLRQVFRAWRYEWGCAYFKTDFMHFGSEYGPDRAVWHEDGLTRIDIWRRTAEMIRDEIGDAVWLGSGCPLWAGIGLLDAVRISRDIGVMWEGSYSAQSLLRDQATRNFGNGILWQADPDCILLRERFHNLSDTEIRSLALYAGMAGGLVTTSDALDELSEDRLRLWKLLLTMGTTECRFPLLGQSPVVYQPSPAGAAKPPESRAVDPVIVQVSGLSQQGEYAVFIFNAGEIPIQRRYPLRLLGLDAPLYAYDWTVQRRYPAPIEAISCTLLPHDGLLLFLSRQRKGDEA
ncbi:MAG: alpha-galactosidase [Anaerolineae bacterium]|nr:alpha-galactosidase [Anaerolineae bacterium]